MPVFLNKKYPKGKSAFVVFGKKFKSQKNYYNLSKNNDLNEAANNLYKIMRKIKDKKFKSISVSKIPNVGIGKAINERLSKAANKWIM